MHDEFHFTRRHVLAGLLAGAVSASAAARLPVEGNMASLDGATGWLNSPPLTTASVRGKVVLIDFWTYTCINWLRTLPYVRAWAGKYQKHGLVVIGVHTPEFDFERNESNVRWAARDMKVDYPVAIDSRRTIWNAFRNQYWPALYFADAQGRIRHHQFGEGDYERSELILRELLTEAGASGMGDEPVSVSAQGAEVAADWGNLKSPENYLGYERTEKFASAGGLSADRSKVYAAPERLRLNRWALAGACTARRESIALTGANCRIACQFHARDLHLVMGPASPDSRVRFRVLVDGQPPGAARGFDLDAEGNGTLTQQRLHQLIRQPGIPVERRFEIEFLDPGAEAFAFTFG